MCPSTQNLLAIQGKLITHLGSLRLDQDEFHLALEVRNFLSSTMPNRWTDRVGWTYQTGKSIQSSPYDF